MRRLLPLILLILLRGGAAQAQVPEYQVKAAMLANFALFVGWPPAAFPSDGSPFVFCVLGSDPFGSWLKHEAGDRVGSRPVEIRRAAAAEGARGAHILFVSQSELPRLKEVLASLQNAAVLVVSDAADSAAFCRQGGMIALVMEGGKVRFDLNASAAARAGLKIDSRLKRVARTTDCGGGR